MIAPKLRKTGYERVGFDGIHVCYGGVYYNKEGSYNYGRDNEPVDKEMVEYCIDWIRKYMKPHTMINLGHTSYGLKHIVEDFRGEYVSNGSFAYAAIKEGYEYILPNDSQNPYFAMIIDAKDVKQIRHSCIPKIKPNNSDPEPEDADDSAGCLSTDGYGGAIDQEDYNHLIKSEVDDADYCKKAGQRWKRLLSSLLYDPEQRRWYDMEWHRIASNTNDKHLENTHPLFRYILCNIFSVVTAIHHYATGPGWSDAIDDDAYEAITLRLSPRSRFPNDDELRENYQEFYELWSKLPIHFRVGNWLNGACYALTLPKAEKLVRYMKGFEFRNIMERLYVLSRKKQYQIQTQESYIDKLR
jgi:hypothetical protein